MGECGIAVKSSVSHWPNQDEGPVPSFRLLGMPTWLQRMLATTSRPWHRMCIYEYLWRQRALQAADMSNWEGKE